MAGIVEDLRRIPMSAGLVATLARASEYAAAQQHDQVALEHLLLALTEDADATGVLTASHVDLALLKADVSQFLGGLTERIQPNRPSQLAIAPDLKRILEAAAAAANQGRRTEINGAIVLAAIVGDGRSSAAHMLRAQGLTFEEAIKALREAMAQAPPAAPPAQSASQRASPVPQPAVDAEDILANARTRVQTRTVAAPIAPVVPVAHARPAAPEGAAVWPPEVRPSGPVDSQAEVDESPPAPQQQPSRSPLTHEALAAELAAVEQAAAQFDDISEPPEMAPEMAHAEPYPDVAPPTADPGEEPLAPIMPPQPRTGRTRPQPGNRWPAPVEPAWRDADPHAAPPAGDQLPPPLPPQGADPSGYWPQYPDPPQPDPGAWQGEPHYNEAAYTDQAPHNAGQSYPAPQAPWPDQAGYRPPEGGAPWPAHDPYAGGEGAPDAGQRPPELHATPPQPQPPPLQPAPVYPAGPPEELSQRPRRKRASQDGGLAAQIAQAIPRKMHSGVASTVEITLSASDVRVLLDGAPGANGQPYDAPIAQSVSVRLAAPDGGFAIEPLAPETQWVNDTGPNGAPMPLSWRWRVTPLHRGRRSLQPIVATRSAGMSGLWPGHTAPEQLIEVKTPASLGGAILRLIGWIALAGAGFAAAKYADVIIDPAIAAVMKALR